MKTTLKYGYANAKVKDSTSVQSIKADILNHNFTIVYKSNPDIKYVYRFADLAEYIKAFALLSNIPSAGKFASVVKKSANNTWKIDAGQSIGTLIQSK